MLYRYSAPWKVKNKEGNKTNFFDLLKTDIVQITIYITEYFM